MATQLAFQGLPDAGTPGDCIAGTVLLLDDTGDAGTVSMSLTLYLSSTNYAYFSFDGGCMGTATEGDFTLAPGTTAVPFWAKLNYNGDTTLYADDSPRYLTSTSQTLSVAPGPVAQVGFDAPSYQVYVGQQKYAYVSFLDANGNGSTLTQPELLTVASADPDAGLLVGFQGCPQDAGPAETTVGAGGSYANLCLTGPRGLYTVVATTPDYGSATATVNICPGTGAGCVSGADCCPDLSCSGSRCCLNSGAYAHTLDCADCCSHNCFTLNPPVCY